MRRFASSPGSLALSLPLSLAVAASALPAQVAYTNRSAFESALASLTTATFEGYASAGSFADVGTPLTTPSAVTGPFTIGTTNPFTTFVVFDGAFLGGVESLGSGATFSPQAAFGTNDIEVTNTGGGGFYAFGFDYAAATGTVFHVFLDGTPFPPSPGSDIVYTQPTTTPLTPQFFGFIANAPVLTVRIETDAEAPVFDNFTAGTPATIPEPATVTLVGVGALALAGLARRRRA